MTRSTPVRLTRTFVSLSRVLLSLLGCLLFVIPWSERYCVLDNFPQGQDFETNLLAFFALAGLMLLLAHLCREGVAALFFLRRSSSRFSSCCSDVSGNRLAGFTTTFVHRAPLPSALSAAYNLPLQI